MFAILAVAPVLSVQVWERTHELQPLEMPISLTRGTYRSPIFTTDLTDNYSIDLDSLPTERGPMHLDWEVVDASGTHRGGGHFDEKDAFVDGKESQSKNIFLTGKYFSKKGQQQRVLLTLRQDVSAERGRSRLTVSLPEIILDSEEGGMLGAFYLYVLFTPLSVVMLCVSLVLFLKDREIKDAT